MRPCRRLCVAAFVVSASLAGAAAPPAHADGYGGGRAPAPGAAKAEEAQKFVAGANASRLSQTDEQALDTLKTLMRYWRDEAVPADLKKQIQRQVDWYARRPSDAVALAALKGLGEIAKKTGGQSLVSVLDGVLLDKTPSAERIAAAFDGLKAAADVDPAVTGPLLRYLTSKDAAVVTRAADTLTAYREAPVALRKRMFETLMSTFEPVAAAAAKGEDAVAVARWKAVGAAIPPALGALSHQQFADVPSARKWFNGSSQKPDAWK